MKLSKFTELEKDSKFKRLAMPQSFIYLSIYIIAPVLFIFVGLLGVLYLFQNQMLISWYSLPYILLFIVGTIWLKAVRRLIVNKKIHTDGSFLVCCAIPLKMKGKKTIFLFTTNDKRHDKYYIENVKKELGDLSAYEQLLKTKQGVIIDTDATRHESIYLTVLKNSDIKKRNSSWQSSNILPVLYIDDKHIDCISGRYL